MDFKTIDLFVTVILRVNWRSQKFLKGMDNVQLFLLHTETIIFRPFDRKLLIFIIWGLYAFKKKNFKLISIKFSTLVQDITWNAIMDDGTNQNHFKWDFKAAKHILHLKNGLCLLTAGCLVTLLPYTSSLWKSIHYFQVLVKHEIVSH